MPYIGNTVQNQGFAPAIDYFSGNGVTVTFTLSRPLASVAQIICAIDNVIQNPSSAFNVSGNSITFTSAPLSGTNNIWVEYTSLITTYQGISQDPSVIGDITATGGYLSTGDFGNSFIDGTLIDYVTGAGRFTVGELDDLVFYHGGTGARSEMMRLSYANNSYIIGNLAVNGTGSLTIPVGTTAQRPGSPTNGMIRYNSTLGVNEIYQNSQWIAFATPGATSVSYLIVAGGGGGGGSGPTSSRYGAGGGGAGGYLTGTQGVTPGTTYTVTVGAGGGGGTGGAAQQQGINGSNSSFTPVVTAAVGGGGGGYDTGPFGTAGSSGGSGGGGAPGSSGAGGSGTAGQGNAGGTSGTNYGGGGGGASAAGSPGSTTAAGGNGSASSITGSSVTYAGGGGGGVFSSGQTPGVGGTGGGGGGGSPGNGGTSGTTNTGGGGGGASGGGASATTGGTGGSGIVVISYSQTFKAATATGTYSYSTSGGNNIYVFTGSGTITF